MKYPYTSMGGPFYRRSALAALAVATVALVAFALLPDGANVRPSLTLHTDANPYGSYTTGRVNVVFPSLGTDVQLSEVANTSVSASLALEQVLETTADSTAPKVDAVAFPSQFNGSGPSGSGSLPFTLSAALQVYPASAGLWAGPGAEVAPNGPPAGLAHLELDYAVAPASGPSSGVEINWTVSGWPWQHAGDLLGIQFGMTTVSGTGLTACTGANTLSPSPSCAGEQLGPGGTVWGSSYVGFEGRTVRGDTASVGWAASVVTSEGSTAALRAGALATSGSNGQFVLAAPAGPSQHVAGTLTFALQPPGLPGAARILVHGSVPWFLGSLAAFAAAGLVGASWYRRRSRALERDL